jgi:hypothetical protein
LKATAHVRGRRATKNLTPDLVKSFFVVGKRSRGKENLPAPGTT